MSVSVIPGTARTQEMSAERGGRTQITELDNQLRRDWLSQMGSTRLTSRLMTLAP